jgi:exoenzyme U
MSFVQNPSAGWKHPGPTYAQLPNQSSNATTPPDVQTPQNPSNALAQQNLMQSPGNAAPQKPSGLAAPAIDATKPTSSDVIGNAALSRAQGPVTLVSGVGDRNLTVSVLRNGQFEVAMAKPPVESLVFSGGGAKGAAYPGAVKALEDAKVLAGVKTVSGSSAGAITASLIAAGNSADEFKVISNTTKFMDLIAHEDVGWLKSTLQAFGDWSGNNIASVLGRLGTPATNLENSVRDNVRASVMNHLNDFNPDRLGMTKLRDDVIAIRTKLQREPDSFVTFADLRTLSRAIPEIKDLNVTGTALIADHAQLAIFNADTSPDMDVAKAVHISAAFPKVFEQVGHTLDSGVKGKFMDGGAMLNIPVPGLVNPRTDQGLIPNPNTMIFAFEGSELSAVMGPDPGNGGTKVSQIKDAIVGARVSAAKGYQTDGLRGYRDQIVPIDMHAQGRDYGTMLAGTLNFSMDRDVAEILQIKLQNSVQKHLDARSQAQVKGRFNTLDEALLALNDAEFNQLQSTPNLPFAPKLADVERFRKAAREGLDKLAAAVDQSYQKGQGMRTLRESAAGALRELDGLAGGSREKLDFLVRAINRPDSRLFQGLLDGLRGRVSDAGVRDSNVLTAALREAERRDVQTAANHTIRDLIFPSRFRSSQSIHNIRVLNETMEKLRAAKTRQAFNAALDHLAAGYEHRSYFGTGTPRTVKEALAAKLPDPAIAARRDDVRRLAEVPMFAAAGLIDVSPPPYDAPAAVEYPSFAPPPYDAPAAVVANTARGPVNEEPKSSVVTIHKKKHLDSVRPRASAISSPRPSPELKASEKFTPATPSHELIPGLLDPPTVPKFRARGPQDRPANGPGASSDPKLQSPVIPTPAPPSNASASPAVASNDSPVAVQPRPRVRDRLSELKIHLKPNSRYNFGGNTRPTPRVSALSTRPLGSPITVTPAPPSAASSSASAQSSQSASPSSASAQSSQSAPVTSASAQSSQFAPVTSASAQSSQFAPASSTSSAAPGVSRGDVRNDARPPQADPDSSFVTLSAKELQELENMKIRLNNL